MVQVAPLSVLRKMLHPCSGLASGRPAISVPFGAQVIVVTARAQTAEKLAAMREAGVDDYITKPFGPGQLVESVERVLGRKR